ncbi:MAG: hypothetical protein ACT4P2_15630 [Pseudomonadota bacterium]
MTGKRAWRRFPISLICALGLAAAQPDAAFAQTKGPVSLDQLAIRPNCKAALTEKYLALETPRFFYYAEDSQSGKSACGWSSSTAEELDFDPLGNSREVAAYLKKKQAAVRSCENKAEFKASCRLIAEGKRIFARSYQEARDEPAATAEDPALRCGQEPDGRAYWLERGFCDLPILGPERANGVILWSHGVSGQNPQYHFPVAHLVKIIALTGWDVFKINRNNLWETGWINAGLKHVADLNRRAAEAEAQGYKRVIAAGQSYGGAISLEAAAVNADIFAVLAFAPGHGSDATRDATRRIFDNLAAQLRAAIAKQKTGRVLVSIAGGDAVHPYEVRGPKVREELVKLGKPFVLFDESMPIKGHGAVSRTQFFRWYGQCILDFIDPDSTPAVGETRCAAPSPAPTFLYPTNLRIVKPAPDLPADIARYSGSWVGQLADIGREVSVVVERIERTKISFVYAVGAGPNQEWDMSYVRRTGVLEGGKVSSKPTNDFRIEFELLPGEEAIKLTWTSRDSKNVWPAQLRRAPPGS